MSYIILWKLTPTAELMTLLNREHDTAGKRNSTLPSFKDSLRLSGSAFKISRRPYDYMARSQQCADAVPFLIALIFLSCLNGEDEIP